MKIIGQDKIIKYIDSCTFDSFPRSLMLIGEKGSGRKLICKYISEKFNLEMAPILPEDPELNLSLTQIIKERIDEMYTSVALPRLYYIDGDYFTSRGRGELNSLLKLLEEPIQTIFLVFFCETTSNVIPTILNRCYKLTMASYTKEMLSSVLTENDWDGIVNIVHNIGQLEAFRRFTPQQVEEIFNYCYKMPDLMLKAAYPNVFRISDKKIYYGGKEEKEEIKITPDEMALILLYVLEKLFLKENKDSYYKAYLLTNSLYNNLKIFNIDKKVLFEHYLIELKVIMNK